MYSAQIAVLAVLAVLVKVECMDFPPVAGLCRPLQPVQLNPQQYAQLTTVLQYDIIYSTDNTPFNRSAHVKRQLVYLGGPSVSVVDTFFYADATVDVYIFNVTFVDNVWYESSFDVNGVKHEFRHYILALNTNDLAVLYYRCSDSGDPGLDTRGIEISSGMQLSEATLTYFLQQDSTYGFQYGSLAKIPLSGN